MPLVSVIVPVYNVERYVSACLDSLRAQTVSDIEIICVVDGSLDRSESIVRMHQALDERIRIIVKDNGGLSSARNAGIRAANGEYLLFVDSDDYLSKNACSVILGAFERTGAEVVTFGAQCVPSFDGNGWLSERLSPRDVVYDGFDPALLFEENSHPYVWRTALKKELLFREQLFFDEDVAFGEDEVFYFSLYLVAKKTALIPDRLYCYRVSRNDSLMSSVADNRLLKVRRHLDIATAILADWKRRDLLKLCPGKMLHWLIDFVVFDLYWVQHGGKYDCLNTECEAFKASDALLELIFDFAPELGNAGRDMGGIESKIVLSMDASRRGGVSWRCPKALIDGFEKSLKGTKRYYGEKISGRIAAFKRALKGLFPLPASSMQVYMMENVERERIERELSDSLQLLQIEYESKFGVGVSGLADR